MGLMNAIQKGALAGIKSLGDLKAEAVYYTYAPGTYNPTTGDSSDVDSRYPLPNDITLVRYKKNEVDGDEVLTTDWKALVVQADIPVKVSKSGRFLINSEFYRIVDIGEDPAHALWILQIRKGV